MKNLLLILAFLPLFLFGQTTVNGGLLVNATAGEAFPALTFVMYSTVDGKVYKATGVSDATRATAVAIGASSGNNAPIQVCVGNPVLENTSWSLTAESWFYLDPANPGQMTATKPTSGYYQLVGSSALSTMFCVNILPRVPVEKVGATLYNRTTTISPFTKEAIFSVTPTTGNGYSIDISALGLTSILGYSITAQRNTATATSAPKVAVKAATTSAITVNVFEGNASLVTLLGIAVLSGTSEQFISTFDVSLSVHVWGN